MYLLELLNLKFLFFCFLIFLINFLLLYFANYFARLLNIFDYPNERKIHMSPTPLIGGVCLFFTISISLIFIYFQSLFSLNKIIIFALFSIIFFAIGIFDDSKGLSPKIKTLIIVITIVFLLPFEDDFLIKELKFKSSNINLNLNYFSFLFTMFCIFALYNALNFIDGYNGSATSIIIFWALFLILKNPNLLYLSLIISMLLIFLYNLSGKIFLGNSGTSIISIFFSLSIINDYNVVKNMFADEILLILLFPGIDMIRVTFERIIYNRKIYFPDNSHFHHYLIKINFQYIWQLILMLTIIPLIIFYIFDNIYAPIFFSIFTYSLLILYFKTKLK